MANTNFKYYGKKITVVNAVTVMRVKYKHKIERSGLIYNLIFASLFMMICVSGTVLVQGVIKITS